MKCDQSLALDEVRRLTLGPDTGMWTAPGLEPDRRQRWQKRGCGQCPHIRFRTGPYIGRIGSDSACFRGSLVFARAGVRFESHLGHVFSLFRGLWASECGQMFTCGPLRGPFLLTGAVSLSFLLWLVVVLLVICSCRGAAGTA